MCDIIISNIININNNDNNNILLMCDNILIWK